VLDEDTALFQLEARFDRLGAAEQEADAFALRPKAREPA
jgi:hypothetical protein